MVIALAVIWVAFNILSGGLFLSPRNLWNLSVQSAAVAIMTTGMVLIIVSRNIDLSIGSILVFMRHGHGPAPGRMDPELPGLRLRPLVPLDRRPSLAGVALGAVIGGDPRLPRRLRRHPVVHRDPGRPADLARRRLPARARPDDRAARHHLPAARRRPERIARGDVELARRRPRDRRPRSTGSWRTRRRRRRYGFQLRPLWADVAIGVVGTIVDRRVRPGREQLPMAPDPGGAVRGRARHHPSRRVG